MGQAKYAARCGIYCGECDYREKMGCPGCAGAAGAMFWGTCPIAVCCMDRELEHCGLCKDFPCRDLKAFAYDEEQGDDGRRIEQLEAWNEIGFDEWSRRRGKREDRRTS